LVLHFSDFSVIFYTIYKNQQTHITIIVALLQGGPWKEKFLCNVAPGGGGRRGLGKFRRCLTGVRPGRVGERSIGHWHSVSGVGRGRGGSGGGVHQRPGVPAAAAGQAGEGEARAVAKVGRRVVQELEEVLRILGCPVISTGEGWPRCSPWTPADRTAGSGWTGAPR
jgi:hypothetical protein